MDGLDWFYYGRGGARMTACPKCGGPGGVLLFMSVAPCDACMGLGKKETVTSGRFILKHPACGAPETWKRARWVNKTTGRCLEWMDFAYISTSFKGTAPPPPDQEHGYGVHMLYGVSITSHDLEYEI